MTKKIFSLIITIFLLAAAGCTAAPPSAPVTVETVKIAALQGPTALSFLKMWEDETKLDSKQAVYELLAAPDAMVTELAKGTYDIAALPLTTAANLFNKGTDYRLVGICTWGNMYIVSTDTTITSLAGLSGKTVAVSQQGATPDVILRYALDKAELSKKVTLDYTLTAHADLAASVISGQTKIALMPEPFVSNIIAKNPAVKVVVDMQQVWASTTGGEPYIPVSAIVVKGSFADANPEAMVDFIAAQKTSAQYTTNVNELADLAEKHGVTLPAAAIISGTPRCNIFFKDTADARSEINNYFNIILGFSPTDIGGVMPSEAFFATFK
jgi:NitT/TauT family transport system substrate-binding protein